MVWWTRSTSRRNRLNEVRPRRPEQYLYIRNLDVGVDYVSMKSGLEDRNNQGDRYAVQHEQAVSMKSGLEDRNNGVETSRRQGPAGCLNEVRPRRPEQSDIVE